MSNGAAADERSYAFLLCRNAAASSRATPPYPASHPPSSLEEPDGFGFGFGIGFGFGFGVGFGFGIGFENPISDF